MKIETTTIPPVPSNPSYKVYLGLTHEEMIWFKALMGSVIGDGPIRDFVDEIYHSLPDVYGNDPLFKPARIL